VACNDKLNDVTVRFDIALGKKFSKWEGRIDMPYKQQKDNGKRDTISFTALIHQHYHIFLLNIKE
jgi:hypothetical protein